MTRFNTGNPTDVCQRFPGIGFEGIGFDQSVESKPGTETGTPFSQRLGAIDKIRRFSGQKYLELKAAGAQVSLDLRLYTRHRILQGFTGLVLAQF